MSLEEQRMNAVLRRIEAACRRAGRDPAAVRLLAVSKQHPPERARALFSLGHAAFGENRLQEAMAKQDGLSDLGIEWHFIGPVQSNKTRDIAARFDWVQSVDRLKVLRRLAEQRPGKLAPLNVCLQVNIDEEKQKAGVRPEQAPALAEAALDQRGIRLRGLMAIPRLTDDAAETRDSLRRMKALFDQLQEAGAPLDTLSMGMSGDLELAVEEGSTMVRIGTDLLGPRETAQANDQRTQEA